MWKVRIIYLRELQNWIRTDLARTQEKYINGLKYFKPKNLFKKSLKRPTWTGEYDWNKLLCLFIDTHALHVVGLPPTISTPYMRASNPNERTLLLIFKVLSLIQGTQSRLFLNIVNESASRSIWIITDISLAPSRIWTHWGWVMQLMKQALNLQATTAGKSLTN